MSFFDIGEKGIKYRKWLICACGIGNLFCASGMATNVLPAFLPLIRDYGYTGGQTSLLVTVRCLASLISLLLIMRIFRRVSLRAGVTMGCIFMGAGYGLMSLYSAFPVYLLGAVLIGFSYSLAGMYPITLLMDEWIPEHRAMAIGLCSCGSGLCALFMPMTVTFTAQKAGTPQAFRLVSMIALMIAAISFIVIRDKNPEKEIRTTENDAASENKARIAQQEEKGLSSAQEKILLLFMVLMGGASISAAAHYTILFTSLGYSKSSAALSITLYGLMLMIGKTLFGWMTDRVGGARSTLLFMGILSAGCFCCCMVKVHESMMFLGTCLMGFGYPPGTVGLSVWARDFSTRERYPVLMRNIQVAFQAGGVLMSPLPGLLFDGMGSYIPSYVLFTFLFLLCTVVVLRTYRVVAGTHSK